MRVLVIISLAIIAAFLFAEYGDEGPKVHQAQNTARTGKTVSKVKTDRPSWSDWEKKNAVAHERDWVVIRQPGENFCYVKQSYHNDTSKVEVTYKDGLALITPFYRGIKGDVQYRVDDSVSGTTHPSNPKNVSLIKLPDTLVPAFRAGLVFYVTVTPNGEQTRTQAISLLGFTAATKWLDTEACGGSKAGPKIAKKNSKSPPEISNRDLSRFRELRDQGIRNLGWVAGNSEQHPIWPQMQPFVDRGGEYYRALVHIGVPGANQEVEAHSNVALYREWRRKGREHPFDEFDNIRRIKRILGIVAEMTEIMQRMKS